MKYCTFSFQVLYSDGTGIHDMIPFRGGNINAESLRSFVRSYFAGPKPISQIEVSNIVEYTDEKKWITTVRNWESFQGLNNMIGFAGDLLHKYFPDEID